MAGCHLDCEDVAVYVDADGDGFGDSARVGHGCGITTVDPGFSLVGGDCDDADAAVFPGAEEVCNDRDDDCSGAADEGLIEIRHPDRDGDGYGDAARAVSSCLSLGPGWVERAGDCDDAEAAAHPDAVELCGDGLDNDCDGAQLPCTGSMGSVGAVVVEGIAAQDYLGTSLALGDFDGDGQEDLLVGARRAGDGSGAAYIVYGPISGGRVGEAGADTAILAGADSEQAGFGVGAADLDGDGWPEVAVGAVEHDSGVPSSAGGVYILPSGTRHSSTPLSEAIFVSGDGWQGRLGRGLSDVGDLNGDGLAELLIGAPEYAHPDTTERVGAAFLLTGGALSSGSITDLGIRILGDDPDSLLAHQGGVGADFDGDGLTDLLTSAYAARDPGSASDNDAGRVYLLAGPITADIDLAAQGAPGLSGTSSSARLGYGMDAADTDGDGYPEAWLGSHGASLSTSLGGAVWQVPGGAALSAWGGGDVAGAATASVVGTELEGSFGSAVSLADLDGDGSEDLAVGAMYRGSGQAGAVAVLYGPIAGVLLDTDADLFLHRGRGDGQAGEHLLVGTGLLGSDGPVLVIGADGESTFTGPEGEVESRDQAGAVFLIDLAGW